MLLYWELLGKGFAEFIVCDAYGRRHGYTTDERSGCHGGYGMSTVVEAIFARYLKMRVAAISCITNKGAGLSENELNHAEVLAALEKNRSQLSDVLFRFIEKI